MDAAAWQGEWYPYYTPRDLAKMWLNGRRIRAEGQGNAPWLADVLQQTELSFLRTALGEGRRVLSKPATRSIRPGTTWARSTMLASWSPILMFT